MTEPAKRSRSGSRTRQTRPLSLYLTAEERAAVAEAADRAALPLSGYVRSVLLQAPPPRQVRRPPIEKQLLGKMVGQLGRLGNNLNQLARLANMGALPVTPETETAIIEAAEDVAAMRKLLIEALGLEVTP